MLTSFSAAASKAKTGFLAFWVCVILSLFHIRHEMEIQSMLVLSPQEHMSRLPPDFQDYASRVNITTIGRRGRLPSELAWLDVSLQNSDFVELEHCSLEAFNVSNFMTWANPILDQAIQKAVVSNSNWKPEHASAALRNEWMLELLEMEATHAGLCTFDRYRPKQLATPLSSANPSSLKLAGHRLQQVLLDHPSSPPDHARIAFSIVAYQDVLQLERLVDAIHLPHHFIVIHVEEVATTTADPEFALQVQNTIAAKYSNVILVQFGTVIYRSDSVSRINLQLMDWMVKELELTYDYHITLGGAAYPLYGASELAQHLSSSGGKVWMGELTHKGMAVHHQQWGVFWKKRLLGSLSSAVLAFPSKSSPKVSVKVGFLFGADEAVPSWIDEALQHKATSGNQAVFHYSTVQALLNNPRAQHIFALAKYGCCCCVEERSWIGAMDILGLLQEAKEQRSMYQLWGGDNGKCVGSMSNAVLDSDERRCFRVEHPERQHKDTNASTNTSNLYIWGNSIWSDLIQAKTDGVLFARKFHSDHSGSISLLEKIRHEIHR